MKKATFFIAAVSALSIVSCKKDRTCSCTTVNSSGSSSTTTTQDITIIDASKSDAKKACIDRTSTDTYTFGGVSTTYTSTTTCELK